MSLTPFFSSLLVVSRLSPNCSYSAIMKLDQSARWWLPRPVWAPAPRARPPCAGRNSKIHRSALHTRRHLYSIDDKRKMSWQPSFYGTTASSGGHPTDALPGPEFGALARISPDDQKWATTA